MTNSIIFFHRVLNYVYIGHSPVFPFFVHYLQPWQHFANYFVYIQMFYCATLKQIFSRLELQPRIVKADVALATFEQQYLATLLTNPHNLPPMLGTIVCTVQSKSVNNTIELAILKHMQVCAIQLYQFYLRHILLLL